MGLPIGRRQVCQTDRVARMVHLVVADINADMRDIIAAAIRPLKEQKVTRLGIFQRNMLGRFILCLRCAQQADARNAIASVRSSQRKLSGTNRRKHNPSLDTLTLHP